MFWEVLRAAKDLITCRDQPSSYLGELFELAVYFLSILPADKGNHHIHYDIRAINSHEILSIYYENVNLIRFSDSGGISVICFTTQSLGQRQHKLN